MKWLYPTALAICGTAMYLHGDKLDGTALIGLSLFIAWCLA